MDIWHDYLNHFRKHFPSGAIRDRCEPRIHAPEVRSHGIVLIHGLTDSPFFMEAIGNCFVDYGFNVYLPLLQCHGLKQPNGMRGVSLDVWKENVAYAVEACRAMCDQVSIGGLSTGGALSVWKAMTDPQSINGGIFLFSAALDIAGRTGNFKEWLSRSLIGRAIDWFHDSDPNRLIGRNPYRYQNIDVGGAGELSRLIRELDQLTGSRGGKERVDRPVFIAHSECDETADIEGADEFFRVCTHQGSTFYRMCTEAMVNAGGPDDIGHAEVVLKESVKDKHGRVLENHNPMFDKMMGEIEALVRQHLL